MPISLTFYGKYSILLYFFLNILLTITLIFGHSSVILEKVELRGGKETILRKFEYQQKVLKFKKTSPYSIVSLREGAKKCH